MTLNSINCIVIQFVNFSEIMSRNISQTRKEAAFALAALMEIPAQYKATLELGILGYGERTFSVLISVLPFIVGFIIFSYISVVLAESFHD